MMKMDKKKDKIIKIIQSGGVGVMATDTLYDLVGSAFSREAVAKIYRLKKRDPKKPLIVLIGSVKELELFGIYLDASVKKYLKKFWPGPRSIILPCMSEKMLYLHRGTNSIAFRLPRKKRLLSFLKKSGPLVAPSANLEGLAPAITINQAKSYFNNHANFYISGRGAGKSSALIKIKNWKIISKVLYFKNERRKNIEILERE